MLLRSFSMGTDTFQMDAPKSLCQRSHPTHTTSLTPARQDAQDPRIRSVHTTNVDYSLAAKLAETSFAPGAAKNLRKVKQIR